MEPLTSAAELDGILVESIGAENGEIWGILLFPTTGNNGCDTGTDGLDTGSPGGVICEDCSAGDVVDGKGGLAFWTGNNGCCA